MTDALNKFFGRKANIQKKGEPLAMASRDLKAGTNTSAVEGVLKEDRATSDRTHAAVKTQIQRWADTKKIVDQFNAENCVDVDDWSIVSDEDDENPTHTKTKDLGKMDDNETAGDDDLAKALNISAEVAEAKYVADAAMKKASRRIRGSTPDQDLLEILQQEPTHVPRGRTRPPTDSAYDFDDGEDGEDGEDTHHDEDFPNNGPEKHTAPREENVQVKDDSSEDEEQRALRELNEFDPHDFEGVPDVGEPDSDFEEGRKKKTLKKTALKKKNAHSGAGK
jgi:hypothetical protein